MRRVTFTDTIHYVCRICGWGWVRHVTVKMSVETIQELGGQPSFDRPISVPACRGCK
jgi:hypothetical protein